MKKAILFLSVVIMAFGQAFAGNWTTRYAKDAFGDSDYSKPVYTVDLYGTTDVVRQGESCTLGVMVYPPKTTNRPFPIPKVFLMRNGDQQNFWSDTQVVVKLSDGKKFSIPCDSENGDLWLGRTPEECRKIVDILNKGNFTLVITSRNYDIVMKCTFNVSNQTTGIKNLVNK